MPTYRYGGKKGRAFRLDESKDMVAVRTESRNPVEDVPLSATSRRAMEGFDPLVHIREAGVQVFQAVKESAGKAVRDKARAALKKEPAIEFAGRVLCEPKSKSPVLYTENLFVKFEDDTGAATARSLLKKYNLEIKRPLEYARNAYFVEAPQDTGQDVFKIAEALLNEPQVEFCHPELVRRVRQRAAFAQQWHLKKATIDGQSVDAHAEVEAAWTTTQGEGTVIAVIDDGVDTAHEEFSSPGKVVFPRDVTRQTNDPRPVGGDRHGTACAGVACADGRFGASGVAPRARLMPIRLASGLGSQAEADAFFWAAQHGADVISNSWGPVDGEWWDPNDPTHLQDVPLPDSSRLAIEWAVRNGRNGKGCVVTWAAGNGNESADLDGYARHPQVIAVAACNDGGKKSAYSDFGRAVWCAFPSNNGNPSKTPGIWTTDRSGTSGYNPGNLTRGDAAGHYTNSFGGTSSACPGVAGVAALVLSRNPELRWDEVKDIIKRACDQIDKPGGNYDASGHSDFYGFGRVNARKAVDLALPPQPNRVEIRTARKDVPIPDLKTATLAMEVADAGAVKSVRVSVEIDHTYIGDLIVTVKPPPAGGAGPVVLHSRSGAGTDNLKRTYDAVSVPALASLAGKSCVGTWTLIVSDKDQQDVGKIRAFSLEMTF